MEARPNKILIFGGGSRIAAALAPLLTNDTGFVSRRPSGHSNEVLVDGYEAISGEQLEGIDCVVNCVGTSDGSASLLQQVNVDIPLTLANRARAAGVRRFVHVSSFSVYGYASQIDAHTPAAPRSAYGASKLAADTVLLQMSDRNFTVAILRLPLIYECRSPGKLGRLLAFWQRARVFPIPPSDVRRAMISAEMAAAVIARLTADERAGILLAADPVPFSYREAARARRESLFTLPIPQWLIRMLHAAQPAMAARLFSDSRLAEDENLAVDYALATTLYSDIANL